ncbi:MAG: hypothetical protein HY300_00965 [Verrucomicrobia bacterium]|nr:hypothetical protein [Verrucomicrobiota bacterium]
MFQRVFLICVTVFWVTMNVLLWRSEFRSGGDGGGAIPIEAVWEKMLRAPDDSVMEVFHKKQRLGSFRWAANIQEHFATGRAAVEDPGIEGMVKQLAGYTIDITEGLLDVGRGQKSVLFSAATTFTTNHAWQTFSLQVNQRPNSVSLRASAPSNTLSIAVSAAGEQFEREWKFDQLRNTEQMLAEFGGAGSLPLELLTGSLFGGAGLGQLRQLAPNLRWEAHNDWMKIGHSRLRVFRLEARLFDKHHIVVHVSRVGEILKVELPDEVVMLNTRLVL